MPERSALLEKPVPLATLEAKIRQILSGTAVNENA